MAYAKEFELTCSGCGRVRIVKYKQHVTRTLAKPLDEQLCLSCTRKHQVRIKKQDKHKFSDMFKNIKQKCFNPDNDFYENFGAVGITIHQPWLEDKTLFFKFLENLNYNPKVNQLVRIDKTKGFEPNNLIVKTKSVLKKLALSYKVNRNLTY